MEIITVHTTQNIDIDYEIGGLGERILAYLIDCGIFLAALFIFSVIFSSTGINAFQVLAWTVYVTFVFYDLICEVFFNGQSIGKLIMKIRVISLDGARPTFSQYLLRWLFRIVDFSITLWLGGLISIAMTENGQRMGDMVAGTAVIKTKPRTKANNLAFVNLDDSYSPVFLQVEQLSDQDMELIREVISNYLKTGNSTIVYTTADRLRQHLSINLPANMNSMQFLQTVVKDYSHLTAQASAL